MPPPRNVLVSAERTINMALDLLDQRKDALCAIVESEHAAPEEKYEALVALAYMTGVLNTTATEVTAQSLRERKNREVVVFRQQSNEMPIMCRIRKRVMGQVVCIDSKHKNTTEIELSLHQMYVNGDLNDEQIMLVEERYPGFRFPGPCKKLRVTEPSCKPWLYGDESLALRFKVRNRHIPSF